MVPTRRQWQNWSLPSKYALVGIILSLIGILASIIPLVTFGTPQVSSAEKYQKLIKESRSELYFLDQCITAHKHQSQFSIKQCRNANLDQINTLFHEYGGLIDAQGYGEFKYIIGFPRVIHNRMEAYYYKISSQAYFDQSDIQEIALLDMTQYEIRFLDWYLCHLDQYANMKLCGSALGKGVETIIQPKLNRPSDYWKTALDFEDYLSQLD